ncbi:hypothetical protein SEVIR_3G112500v4 [Setaria viridis]|uniref:Acid phosphatase n=1 Tax=Setaria viridis TaxID=4556 RepID=A0A4U6VA66_SETVI|nr:stem 31 kDa glycoprotein-like isoform X1 [Setaria viridis]TKW25335.1 hypothetical protein SEVIR_3G112500v2 [Setaria viridis]
MALRLPSLLVLLLMVHATRARDMGLEMMTTSAASGAGAGITSSGAPAVASCPSWRLGVETNNIRGWYSIPAECRGYVRDYMFGDLFRQDCAVVVREAAAYAEGLELAGDGEAVWVFDIDDTALSNLPYYADTGFGAQPYNATYFEEYVAKATAPALPEVLELYEKLLALGIKVAFITGRHEYEREPTVKNLRSAGYHTWEKLVLKPRLEERSSKGILQESLALAHLAVVAGFVGGAVQVRRASEAGRRRVPHRWKHRRPVERPRRRAGGRPHLQGARPHVLRRLNSEIRPASMADRRCSMLAQLQMRMAVYFYFHMME